MCGDNIAQCIYLFTSVYVIDKIIFTFIQDFPSLESVGCYTFAC